MRGVDAGGDERDVWAQPEDCDFLKAPPQRGFRIEMSFDK